MPIQIPVPANFRAVLKEGGKCRSHHSHRLGHLGRTSKESMTCNCGQWVLPKGVAFAGAYGGTIS